MKEKGNPYSALFQGETIYFLTDVFDVLRLETGILMSSF